MELINHTLGILPRCYKRRRQNGSIKEQVYRPSRLSMMIGDPSEAVESSRILPLLESHFDIVGRKNYGGTILAMLFDGIAHNFLGDDGETRQLIELCFEIEDTFLELEEIQHNFAFLVCQPKSEIFYAL